MSVAFGSDGQMAGRYRKIHIPHGPGYEEKYYFTPGDLGFQVVKVADVSVGLAICWALGLLFTAIAVAIVVYLLIQGLTYLKPSMLVTPACTAARIPSAA